MLGIPTVVDRFIQQMLLQAMTPIWEPRFSEHSYGFRPGRKAADAVRAAQGYAERGKDWVVDLDITKFFDHVNGDILMGKIAEVIGDKRVLKLIGKYLRAGAMADGVVVKSVEGTPQGGPLSPRLANIYWDALDRELERRGHKFSRYADDCNIYVGSQAAAERVMESVQGWIEKHLRLQVNATKSGVGRTWERKFLGFRLNRERQIEAAPESVERFKTKVREKWRSCQSLTSNQLRDTWRQYVRGWWGYYQLAENRRVDLPTGGMDSPAYPEMLLAAVAQARRERAQATQVGTPGAKAQGGPKQSGSLASGRDRQPAKRALERHTSPLWLPHAIGSSGLLKRLFQPPDAENRMSGGVGGCRGAIPVTRPDHATLSVARSRPAVPPRPQSACRSLTSREAAAPAVRRRRRTG